ncbi:MAG: cupin domain-containing protein [Chloroflexi bacterium]|nr:MAG: cupin domain-containing protein [Chloroflexota bacterium]
MRASSGGAGPDGCAAISRASSTPVSATFCSRGSTRSTRRGCGSRGRARPSNEPSNTRAEDAAGWSSPLFDNPRVGRKISLRDALSSDPAPLRAPPAWTNSELGTVNGVSVLHAGSGKLDGRWHRQTSDEFLIVLEGELIVEFDAGPLAAGPGEAILIAAGERHRAAVHADCLLLSVEGVGMERTDG